MAATPSKEPRWILDRYRLEERIAIGGTAEVWRAQDETLGRQVAVKLLHEHLLPDEPSRRRIEAEARAAAGLTHPGIVDVYDIAFSEHEAAIVMELVRGRPLSEVLERHGALPPVEAARIGAQIAEALEHAHERGLVHRDVKPGNVLVTDEGRARLVDFGIARQLEENARRLTTAGTVVGTLRYMAPEQLAGEPGDQRTDVYALGATLYEMLAGRPPFDAEAPGALLEQQRRRPPPVDGVPTQLMDIAQDALEADPDRRTRSPGEVGGMLRAWLVGPGALGPQAGDPTGVITPPTPSGPPRSGARERDAGAGEAARPARSQGRTDAAARPRRRLGGAPGRGRRIARDARPLAVALLVTVGALLVVWLVVTSPGSRGSLGGGDLGDLPTKESTATRDARVALAGDFRAGAGANDTLPVGFHRDFLYRSLVGFEPDWSGMERVRRIELRLCTSGESKIARGDDPSIRIERNAEGDWNEGESDELSSRNAVTWATKPDTTDDGAVGVDPPARRGECANADITQLYLPFVPHVLDGGGQPDRGLTLRSASDDGSAADPRNNIEFWSSEAGGQGPRLIVTYEGS